MERKVTPATRPADGQSRQVVEESNAPKGETEARWHGIHGLGLAFGKLAQLEEVS